MKHFSKIIIALLVHICAVTSVFATKGIMAGEGKIKMAQTKWFDIIYGEVAEDSASVLYANADQIYQELADMYGWKEPPCRMPVVLTTQVEVFNAYFSTGNYNHIVLYVTNPIDELSNQPDVFLWTFRHELTHAYTYNMKGKMAKAWSSVFGDSSSFHTFTVTPGVAEGATLTSESYNGNGRLNDEFAKQYVKQAKLENKFPKYNDVQGSRDIYPSGCFYHFNGAFHEYLQKKYGLEKYADFWYNCINNAATTAYAFKKAYGLDLKKEWDKFAESYKVPQIPGDPLQAKAAKDFFISSSDEYSIENTKGALYSHISQSEKGITFIDEKNNTVYFVSKNDLAKQKIIPTPVFQYFFIESATQSLDGKYITISYYDISEANYRYYVAIYDTDSKKWYKTESHGVKEGIVVKQGSDYYLSVLQFKGEKSKNRITKLIINNKGEIVGEENENSHDFTRTQLATSFVPVKDGVFAYILCDKMKYSIYLADVNGNLISEYKAPVSKDLTHFIMHYLSVNESNPNELYFSWVSEGTMPRVGKLNLSDVEYTLSLEDLSGGIYYPVKYGDELIYVGEFFEYNKMFKKTAEFKVGDKYAVEISDSSDFGEDLALFNQENDEKLIPSINDVANVTAFNPFRFVRGTFIPLSQLQSVSYDSEHYGSYSLPLGITYTTNNPWDSMQYMFSAGYGFKTNSFGLELNLSGNTDTSLFSWGTKLFSEFDLKGWKAAEIGGNINISKSITNKLTLDIFPSASFYAGRPNASAQYLSENIVMSDDTILGDITSMISSFGKYGNHDDLFYLHSNVSALVGLGNLRTVLDNRFGRKGFLVGFNPAFNLSYDVTNSTIDYKYEDVSFFGKIQLPRIIPIDCEYGRTYNLPIKFVAAAFSTSSVLGNLIYIPTNISGLPTPNLAVVSSEMVLYAQEIQKSLLFMYFHDVYLSLIGAFGFDYVSHSRENFGIQYTLDFLKEIATGVNKPMAITALKASVGLNFLNIGALARSTNKNYFCVVTSLTFPTLTEKPVLNANLLLDVRF